MKVEVKIPTVGESINEVTIGSWLKEDGAFVELDDILCEIESEKATVEIVAEAEGVLSILVPEGDTVSVGTVIANLDAKAKPQKSVKKAKADEKADTKPVESSIPEPEKTKSRMSPVAANILKESGVDPDQISGSGSGGKITKEDALQAIREQGAQSQATAVTKTADKAQRGTRRVRMTTLRKTISRRLLEAKHGTAMLTTFNEVDLSAIKELRARYKDAFKEKYDVSLGFMSFFTRAVTTALSEFPVINARIDGEEIVYHDYCDIGIAVSTDRGLVVPIIRNADSLSLAEIEQQVAELAVKARENKLTIEEMTGGTFSITNGGVFGSLLSTPILNTPQSAILGMHTIQDRPVVRDGQIAIRPMMYVALSYDHRLIDGKDSVQFLVKIKEYLEDPSRMLLEI